ncbi:MAG: DUF2357 domain-containing protein [Clostridia bacterium]|nr:DUF2357 domain-containing protein [Clostridia bacterium]
MATSYEELYGNYQSSILALTSSDDYYDHMLDAMETGKTEVSLFNRFFEKKIDLKWVEAIEACIIPLDTIVRNPRKFIVQEEEIVPIERAKKITAESIRHLAQHTNMIARVDGDRVTPNQILNVFREESYEIYENRFIFTLLRNLRHFIDTRYNVLFNMEQDENMSSLKMNSEFKRGNETVTYKLEVSTQASAVMRDEHLVDARGAVDENATALERIERIKRIINGFCGSSFMRDLENCTPVRPPIMRTNVIQKNPDFRACLTLWQFISSYDEVGYEIVAKESDEIVADEYKSDLFKLATVNYMLLKKNVGEEIFEEAKLRKRKLKPKMLKRLAEDLVLNYDMEEVEIRRVFIDELKRANKKKTAGETKINEALDRALASEAQRKAEIEAKIKAEIQRQKDIEKRKKEREKARIAKELELEKQRKAREKARIKAQKEKAIALEKERKAKEKEKLRKAKLREQEQARIAKEKEKARIEREKAREAKLRAQEEERKQKEALKKEQEKAKALALAEAQKEKERAAKQREKERIAKQKADALAKEKAAKAKQKEKEKLAREKALAEQKAKEQAAKAKEKEKRAKEKALAEQKAKEQAAKAKQKEKERIAKEKAAAAEKERIAKEKQKAKEKAEKEKALQAAKEKAAKERAKEKEKMAKQRALQQEKERLAKQKQKEKEKAARQKALQQQKAKAAADKAKSPAKAPAESTPADEG